MSPAVLSVSVKNDVRISVPIFYFSNMGNSTQLIYLFEYPQQKYIVPWVFQVWFNYFNLDKSTDQTEAYLEPSRTTTMKLFQKIVNG